MSPHKAWVCLKMAIIDMPVINRVKEDHELEKKQLQGETKPAALAIYKEMWKLSSEWEYPGRLRQRHSFFSRLETVLPHTLLDVSANKTVFWRVSVVLRLTTCLCMCVCNKSIITSWVV